MNILTLLLLSVNAATRPVISEPLAEATLAIPSVTSKVLETSDAPLETTIFSEKESEGEAFSVTDDTVPTTPVSEVSQPTETIGLNIGFPEITTFTVGPSPTTIVQVTVTELPTRAFTSGTLPESSFSTQDATVEDLTTFASGIDTITEASLETVSSIETGSAVSIPTINFASGTDITTVEASLDGSTSVETGSAVAIATTPVVVDAKAVLNGVDKVEQFETSDFCKQFIGQIAESNGSQFKNGGETCSSTPLGLLPDASKMMSTLIIEPAYGSTIDASVNNTISVKVKNLDSGFFNNANEEYYLVPSTLNAERRVVQGHCHVTVQFMGDGTELLNPREFDFFKGINDVAIDSQKELLSASIPAGTLKKNGLYRICALTGSAGHQSALSPVVERGPQEDCIRMTVENAVDEESVKVADDSAQNVMVTVDGKESGEAASSDNSGQSASGENIDVQIEEKIKDLKEAKPDVSTTDSGLSLKEEPVEKPAIPSGVDEAIKNDEGKADANSDRAVAGQERDQGNADVENGQAKKDTEVLKESPSVVPDQRQERSNPANENAPVVENKGPEVENKDQVQKQSEGQNNERGQESSKAVGENQDVVISKLKSLSSQMSALLATI